MYSALLLAQDPDGSDVLYAHEISRLDLRHVRCVVLAACSTSRSEALPTEGVAALADAFIVAGVPTVIDTLWDLDDRAGPPFARAFYSALRSGRTVVESLRLAQLSLLRSGGPESDPRTWAAFEAFGKTGF